MQHPQTDLDPAQVSYFVLAGGKSRRMGRNKALIELDGQPLIERIVRTVPGKKVAIIANQQATYRFLHLPVLADIYPGIGPMAGLHSGLLNSDTEYNFFLACDLPRLKTETILRILAAHCGEDFVGPQTSSGIEPLCALYARRLLPGIERAVSEQRYGLQDYVASLRRKRLLRFEDESIFFNLNTLQEWKALGGDKSWG